MSLANFEVTGPPLDFREFDIKTENTNMKYASGMEREDASNKIDFTLIMDGPMYRRWAQHLTKGAKKYKKRNWMQATGQEELDRFLESAARHFYQWMMGETDEDHAAAVFFNINGAEFVRAKLCITNAIPMSNEKSS